MIHKIISGGQTGADQAGLYIAKKYGIETGGWAPKGWITSDGPNMPLLQKAYNLQEHSGGYKKRTWSNVEDSDATIRLATNFNSPGEICTMNAIKRYDRPHFDVDLNNLCQPKEVVKWLESNFINVLNIAGNTQKKNLDVFNMTVSFLDKVLSLL